MTRYAVYAIPGAEAGNAPESAKRLYDTAERWYARKDMRDVTASARSYGFHATLKAPFRLAGDVTEADLQAFTAAFAAQRQPVVIPAPKPAALGKFRALIPTGDQNGINELAADIVHGFDGLRAPFTDREYQRRRPEELSARQRALLDQWGYPYVLEEFVFHLTLTDPLPEGRIDDVDRAIATHFADVGGVDVLLASLVICIEPAPGEPFQLLSRHPFSNSKETF